MLQTELVADRPHLLQCPGREVELLPCVRVDGVDHEVGVWMLRIHVGGHQHLTAGEEPLRQLQGDLVGLRKADLLLGGEGLDVVVEKRAAGFAVQILGGQEALLCHLCPAVDAGEILPPIWIHRLFLLGDVAEHPAHGPGGLLMFPDEAARCHRRSPRLSLSAAGLPPRRSCLTPPCTPAGTPSAPGWCGPAPSAGSGSGPSPAAPPGWA